MPIKVLFSPQGATGEEGSPGPAGPRGDPGAPGLPGSPGKGKDGEPVSDRQCSELWEARLVGGGRSKERAKQRLILASE